MCSAWLSVDRGDSGKRCRESCRERFLELGAVHSAEPRAVCCAPPYRLIRELWTYVAHAHQVAQIAQVVQHVWTTSHMRGDLPCPLTSRDWSDLSRPSDRSIWNSEVMRPQPDFSDPQCSAALVKHLDASARRKWRLLNRACCEDVYGTVKTLTCGGPWDPDALDEAKAMAEQDVECVLAAAAAFSSLLEEACRGLQATKLRVGRVQKVQFLVHLDVEDDVCWQASSHAEALENSSSETIIKVHGRQRVLPRTLLSKLPNLTLLSCSDLAMSSLHDLPPGLHPSNLELDISCSELSLAQSADRLRNLPLQSLSIWGDHMKTADSEALSVLGPTLQELRLTKPYISEPVPGLAALTNLRSLTVECGEEGSYGSLHTLARLAAVLPAMTSLTHLDVSGLLYMDLMEAQLSEEDVRAYSALGLALSTLGQLQQLDLSAVDVGHNEYPGSIAPGPLAYPAMLQRLAQATPPLERLVLTGSLMGPAGMAALAPALPAFERTLQVLHLEDSALGAEGAALLAPALGRLGALRMLDLGSNEMQAKGVEALAPALAQLQQLQGLCLCGNLMRPAGASALAAHMSGLTELRQLLLGGNQLGDAGAEALRPALPSLTTLTLLDLGRNQLGTASADAGGWKAAAPSLVDVHTEQWYMWRCITVTW